MTKSIKCFQMKFDLNSSFYWWEQMNMFSSIIRKLDVFQENLQYNIRSFESNIPFLHTHKKDLFICLIKNSWQFIVEKTFLVILGFENKVKVVFFFFTILFYSFCAYQAFCLRVAVRWGNQFHFFSYSCVLFIFVLFYLEATLDFFCFVKKKKKNYLWEKVPTLKIATFKSTAVHFYCRSFCRSPAVV